jgi:hypothetical protein
MLIMAIAMSNVANADSPGAGGLAPDPAGIGCHVAAGATFQKSRLDN